MNKFISRFSWASLLLLAFACGSDEVKDPADQNDSDKPATEYKKPANVGNLVVAHRGGASESGSPDNSIAGLNYTISLGCYAAECDIYITQDNKVIVAHADGDSKVNGLYPWNATYAQIAAAGNLSNGEKIPLLEDFLDVVLKGGKSKLWIDVKTINDTSAGSAAKSIEYSARAAEKAGEIIREKKAKYFVEFIVGRIDVLKRAITAAQGDWGCGYMNAAYSPANFTSAGLNWANLSTESAFYYNGKVVGKYLIEDYTKVGVKVSVFNVDTDADRAWYVANASKLYAICTNYPFKLLSVLK